MGKVGFIRPLNDNTFEWNIRNYYSRCQAADSYLESPEFAAWESWWHLRIYPNGITDYGSVGQVGLYLYKGQSDIEEHNVDITIGIKTKYGSKYKLFKTTENFLSYAGHGTDNLVERSKLLRNRSLVAPRNVLNVTCTIQLLDWTSDNESLYSSSSIDLNRYEEDHEESIAHFVEDFSPSEEDREHKECAADLIDFSPSEEDRQHNEYAAELIDFFCSEENAEGNEWIAKNREGNEDIKADKAWRTKKSENDVGNGKEDKAVSTIGASESLDILSNDFKHLLLNEVDCDVKIKVKNHEFSAHRLILAARSPVFASMFKHNMIEKNTGVVNINDCEAGAFKQFLYYLYSGNVDELSVDNIFDLYGMASKYVLEDLKKICLQFMEEELSVDSFCDTITLAVKYSETHLLNCATIFFMENAKEVLLTVKWQIFLRENPTEANELYLKLLNK